MSAPWRTSIGFQPVFTAPLSVHFTLDGLHCSTGVPPAVGEDHGRDAHATGGSVIHIVFAPRSQRGKGDSFIVEYMNEPAVDRESNE